MIFGAKAKGNYTRLLLKLSGEILMGKDPFGINHEACSTVAQSLKNLRATKKQVAVVIGGGNIFRGIKLKAGGLPATPADHMGMLSTLINGIALQQALLAIDCPTVIMSALNCPKVAEPYNWEMATKHLSAGDLVLFVGGTGNPYFTTDTAAALRASEIQADILLKATKVDGIYDQDPKLHSDATKYDEMTYSQLLADNLQVMDSTAVALCRTNMIPLLVFNMHLLLENKLTDLLAHPTQGTLVTSG